ncbi:MAG TPA: hypothetical protein VJT71_12795 [Pyrinomonadaceae bacterium]|nr:hypothetical protein [Pyrinomonadaceae bacterium]
MTPDDTQIDVLMRRYAGNVKTASVGTEHLDADELNAFAEGTLPAATRSSYVSHLADCDDCRKIATQLTMATGAVANAQVPASEAVTARSWSQKLGALFSAPALRYAASVLVLVVLVGISLLVWRRTADNRNSSLIARNEPNTNQIQAVSSPAVTTVSQDAQPAPSIQTETRAATAPNLDKIGEESTLAGAPPPPPAPAKDAAETEAAPAIAAKAPAEPRAEGTPSYAPQPSADNYRVDNRQREQQNIGNIHGGPRRNESQEKLKVIDDRARNADLAKARDEDRGSGRANQQVPAARKQEQSGQTRAGAGVLSSSTTATKESDAPARKSDKTAQPESDEKVSVGGRKFRRQGNVWVDTKFKSSMPTAVVARGSSDFSALDSGLRSIAQQLGGDVIVVWKGKAYRIR